MAEGWSTLGVILTQVGDLGALREGDGEAHFEKAEAAFRKALAIDPGYWMATHGLGLLFERRGRYEEAAREYEKIASVPGVPPAVRGNLERARACVGLPPWACDLLRAEQEAAAGNYPVVRILAERALPSARGEAGAADPRLAGLPARARYNLACVYSLLSAGRAAPRADPVPVPAKEAARLRAAALEQLALAFEGGWADFVQSRKDGDLDPIKGEPEFERLVRAWEEKRKG
ncbi:MAG: hypothetical protein MUC63_11225 [Planctomycetes bacterium]|nr:hypothetical protein [Planctomycetota bacterium]